MAIGDELAASLPRLRANAESLMRDTVRVERVTGTTTSPEPPFATVDTYETVYEGKGKVQTYEAQETNPDLGDSIRTVQRYAVHLPVGSCAPEVGMRIVVTVATLDPNLTGRTYRVVALLHKTAATAYRLGVEQEV